jgi:hypothetical protein
MVGKLIRKLLKFIGKLFANTGKPCENTGVLAQKRPETLENTKVNQHRKPEKLPISKTAILTARPENMRFSEYRTILREQGQRIKHYLRGRLFVAMEPSSRNERRERARLSQVFDKAEKPYRFHPKMYARLRRYGFILPS